jgi:multidrug resistance protein
MISRLTPSLRSQSYKNDVKTDDASDDADDSPVRSDLANENPRAFNDLDRDNQQQHSQTQSKDEAQNDPHFKVSFEDGDPENPKNWSAYLKAWITLQLGLLAFVGSLGSSIVSPTFDVLTGEFGISREVAVLAVALYILGFAFGPMMWGPISEVYGRKWSMLPAVTILALFSIGSATSRNAQSFFITRFFAGLFASAPVSNVSAALGDIYEAKKRGVAMSFYSIMVVGGPCLGPLIGSSVTVNPHLGWRWTEYLEAILAGSVAGLVCFGMPEIYAPVLLRRKAQRTRKETGDNRYWHPHEAVKITPKNVLTKYFSRPLLMLLTEPTVTCIALYASFVYANLYLFLEVFPIVFAEMRGYGPVVSTLPFLGLFTGTVLAIGVNVANQPRYMKAVEKNNGKPVPEARLPPLFVGSVLFAVGLFWFGWTADPSYSVALPIVAAVSVGAGFNVAFQQCLNYLVDEYGMYAASATSANTILRSLFACGLPMAAGPMFRNMGVGPAASLLGGISCLALPVP